VYSASVWGAVSTWARAHDDVALTELASKTLVKIDPQHGGVAAAAAEELAGVGEIGPAQAIALATAQADDVPRRALQGELVARLAVDAAISTGDAGLVRQLATRVHVSLEEAAARALLGGAVAVERALASSVTLADESAYGARLVLAAQDGRDIVGAVAASGGGGETVSAAAWVAFGEAVVHAASPEVARAALDAIAHGPITPGDDRVGRPAAGLAARGAIDPAVLPANDLVEFEALRAGHERSTGFRQTADDGAPGRTALDPRHEYLALALRDPTSPRARELGLRLGRLAPTDPVTALAAAIVARGTGAPIDIAAARAASAHDPSDPLFSVLLRLSQPQ